jgi:hypothetical protein
MLFECKFCKNNFSTKSNLNSHQKGSKYCLKIQGKEFKKSEFLCEDCNKKLSSKQKLNQHQTRCFSYKERIIKETIHKEYKTTIESLNILKNQVKDHKKTIEKMSEEYKELLSSYQRLAEIYTQDGKRCVNALKDKFLKKRARTKYPGENVIYVLTTPSLKKDRRYILGKAVNLTKRLSTYNKSDEHEVVFYASCPDREKMGIVEGLVFSRLSIYREKANRERFILPVNGEVEDVFAKEIKKCIDFVI